MSKKIDFKMITDLSILIGTGISLYYLINSLLNAESGPIGRSKENKEKQEKKWIKLIDSNPDLVNIRLSAYERDILSSVVTPDEIKVTFKDIGGLDSIIDGLHESVIYPLTMPELYSNNPLLQAPSGVLFYGPPGCGKTMLAKAIAKESGVNFISIRMSAIMDKYYGESNKIVDATFSLANKIEPCIIFIDEIDSFLRERSSMDHEATATLKAEFMSLWDGLINNGRIMVIGATNRMNDIDSAFLRRLPKRFFITLPGEEERKKILQIFLKDVPLDKKNFDFDKVARLTSGLSGADLKELCREAALKSAKEYIKFRKTNELLNHITSDNTTTRAVMRPLRTDDFFNNDEPFGIENLD